jgi:hypothetical protein
MRQTLRSGWTAVLVDQERGDTAFAARAVAWPLQRTDASVTMATPLTEQDLRRRTLNTGQPVRRVRPLGPR